MGRALAISVVLLLAGACARQAPAPGQSPQPARQAGPATGEPLRGKLDMVNIYEERTHVSEPGRLLFMPETTIVGNEDDVDPPIDDALRALVTQEVTFQFEPGGAHYHVDVYVVHGHQSFHVGETRETVNLRFSVRVEVIRVSSGESVKIGEGNATDSIEAVDIAPQNVETAYMGVVRQSIRNAFRHVRTMG